MVSLVVSTVLTAFGNYLDSILPFGKVILTTDGGRRHGGPSRKMAVRVSVSTSMNLKAAKIVYSTHYVLKCRPAQRMF